MQLSAARAGPYLRAIQAGLHALAPDDDHVPLFEGQHHLQALDPALSAQELFPAEVDAGSGLPAFGWLERAIAAHTIAHQTPESADPDDVRIARARELDPQLGARLAARRALTRFLRQHALLPASCLRAVLRRLGQTTDFSITADRLTADGRWTRLRVDVSGPRGWERTGPLRIVGNDQDARQTVVEDPGVVHLLARHVRTPLCGLHAQLESALGARVLRLSRAQIGPFWFPGVPLPPSAPPALGAGLVLHTALELVGSGVHRPVHADPWMPPPAHEPVPAGQAVYRERRLAVSPNLLDAARGWRSALGRAGTVVVLRPPAVRKTL